jgi:hypothetical protein
VQVALALNFRLAAPLGQAVHYATLQQHAAKYLYTHCLNAWSRQQYANKGMAPFLCWQCQLKVAAATMLHHVCSTGFPHVVMCSNSCMRVGARLEEGCLEMSSQTTHIIMCCVYKCRVEQFSHANPTAMCIPLHQVQALPAAAMRLHARLCCLPSVVWHSTLQYLHLQPEHLWAAAAASLTPARFSQPGLLHTSGSGTAAANVRASCREPAAVCSS